jgi:hypothetical protein
VKGTFRIIIAICCLFLGQKMNRNYLWISIVVVLLLSIHFEIGFAFTDYESGENDDNNFMESTGGNTSEYETELKLKKEEALKLKVDRDRKKNAVAAVKRVLHANESDKCEFLLNPIQVVKGKVCGSYYKVLQLNRFSEDIDKQTIKKAFRSLSLSIHPDKNPSKDALTAFKIVQNAYECLADDSCKNDYDDRLQLEESAIHNNRMQLKNRVIERSLDATLFTHKYATMASNWLIVTGRKVWDAADKFTVAWNDETEIPIGKVLLSLVGLWKLKFTAPLAGFAFLIAKLNQELMKQRIRSREGF